MSIRRDQRGFFTLIELLTACAVLVLALAAVVTVQQTALQAYVTGSNKTEVQQNVRGALERMARDFRQTPSALTAASTTSVTFVDQNGGISTTYLLTNNTTLTRRTANGDEPLIGGVQSLQFVFWDGNSPPAQTATPANIRRIDITIQTSSEDNVVPGGVADTKAAVTTSVRLRNLS